MSDKLVWDKSTIIEFVSSNWMVKESEIMFAIEEFIKEKETMYSAAYPSETTNSTSSTESY